MYMSHPCVVRHTPTKYKAPRALSVFFRTAFYLGERRYSEIGSNFFLLARGLCTQANSHEEEWRHHCYPLWISFGCELPTYIKLMIHAIFSAMRACTTKQRRPDQFYKNLCNVHVRFFKNALAYFVSGTILKAATVAPWIVRSWPMLPKSLLASLNTKFPSRRCGDPTIVWVEAHNKWLRFRESSHPYHPLIAAAFCFCTRTTIRPSTRNDQQSKSLYHVPGPY
jgi:hypothetical protein